MKHTMSIPTEEPIVETVTEVTAEVVPQAEVETPSVEEAAPVTNEVEELPDIDTVEVPKQLAFSPKSPRARANKTKRVKSQQIDTIFDKENFNPNVVNSPAKMDEKGTPKKLGRNI